MATEDRLAAIEAALGQTREGVARIEGKLSEWSERCDEHRADLESLRATVHGENGDGLKSEVARLADRIRLVLWGLGIVGTTAVAQLIETVFRLLRKG